MTIESIKMKKYKRYPHNQVIVEPDNPAIPEWTVLLYMSLLALIILCTIYIASVPGLPLCAHF